MIKSRSTRFKVDWDAVERDYRTAKFTLRELASKHGVSHQAIAKKVKLVGWTQDLAVAISQATKARLVQDLVDEQVAKSGQEVASTVLMAAELNKQIIVGHRKRLSDLQSLVEAARYKVHKLGGSVADIREAAVFVQAVSNLVGATKTLIEQERKAFGIDDEDKGTSGVDELLMSVGRSPL